MNDGIIRAKRLLNETEAMWNLALGSVFPDERNQAFQAYRDAVLESSKSLATALDDWLERHPVKRVED